MGMPGLLQLSPPPSTWPRISPSCAWYWLRSTIRRAAVSLSRSWSERSNVTTDRGAHSASTYSSKHEEGVRPGQVRSGQAR